MGFEEIDLEKSRKITLKKMDRILSDIEYKEIIDQIDMFMETLYECYRLDEPKDYEALDEIYRQLIELIKNQK